MVPAPIDSFDQAGAETASRLPFQRPHGREEGAIAPVSQRGHRSGMLRLLLLTHRYLGIAVGWVISLWCLSGFVMMYVPYPELTPEERLAGLEPLDLFGCCQLPEHFAGHAVEGFTIEMATGRPVLRLFNGRQQVIDLASGEVLGTFDGRQARAIAHSAARAFGAAGAPELRGLVERDQWTVAGSYHPHRPLYHFAAGDPAGTEFYVSSTTGEVVQMTTAGVRFWNWIGAVPHWLYPTVLRQHSAIWAQVVIWLSIVSLFLTVAGITIGYQQFRFRRRGGWSPYKGWWLWHHYLGLAFGLFTLTWLLSGLFSVNPWGAFEGRSFAAETARLRGPELDYDDIRSFLRLLGETAVPVGTVRLTGAPVTGDLGVVAADAEGSRQRLAGDSLRIAPLAESYFASAAAVLRPDEPLHDAGWIAEGDAYYYTHHETRRFPVFRIRYRDGERFYLDDVSGELAFAVDRERRWGRWAFHALHRGDFTALLRSRPLWDVMMWFLLLGVTAAALTGNWLGCRRMVRWILRANER